ncbi:MAG TPA: aminopeptidase, partial [Lysobacter sp.]|nr:aminopeptidase [Lysobacter sp.]
MKRPLLPCLLGAVLVAACKPPAPATDTGAATSDRADQGASFNPAITADDFARHVRTLASDEFA